MVDNAVSKLAAYALQTGLIQTCEKDWAVTAILDVLKIYSYTDPGQDWGRVELAPVLEELLDDAYARGVLAENSVVYRDLFDTELMGRLTPRPAQVIEKFQALYREDPQKATDWSYEGHPMEGGHALRRAGRDDQSVQAGEGPQGHCGGEKPPGLRLSPVSAVRGK